jgi:hypothetical protein
MEMNAQNDAQAVLLRRQLNTNLSVPRGGLNKVTDKMKLQKYKVR